MRQLIEMRIKDLILNHEARSLFSDTTGQELLHEFQSALASGRTLHSPERATELYQDMKAAVVANNSARAEYMMVRLERGEHPDTHPDFWSGFEPCRFHRRI